MTIGTVRWFDVRKGYGFLKPDDGGVDVLVDVCAVERAGMASCIKASASASTSCTIRGSANRAQTISALLDCGPERA
jgi:CspA family cold shock protein